jgi:hypothetical protein
LAEEFLDNYFPIASGLQVVVVRSGDVASAATAKSPFLLPILEK